MISTETTWGNYSYQELGLRLRAARENAGVTLDVASKIVANIEAVEAGDAIIEATDFTKLARQVYHCTLHSIMCANGPTCHICHK